MREITVGEKDAGQRLNKFLMRYLNHAPSGFIYKMLRKKNIVLNGVKAKGKEIVNPGDTVKLFLADETIDKFRVVEKGGSSSSFTHNFVSVKLDILYEDNDILAVNKPVGMLSQKADKNDISMNELIVDYYNNRYRTPGDTFKPSVCNRLDRNTSGIILAGLSLKGSRELSRALKDRSIDKYYYTIVKGVMVNRLHETAYISRNEAVNKSEVISEAEYKRLCADSSGSYDRIETEFIPMYANGSYTLLKVKLITGKSHQIRAHLAKCGHAVIGDNKYGDVTVNRFFRDKYKLRGQLLHAGEVILSSGLRIVAPLPDKFMDICDGLGLNAEL